MEKNLKSIVKFVPLSELQEQGVPRKLLPSTLRIRSVFQVIIPKKLDHFTNVFIYNVQMQKFLAFWYGFVVNCDLLLVADIAESSTVKCQCQQQTG